MLNTFLRIARIVPILLLSSLVFLPAACRPKPENDAQDHLLTLTLDWFPEPEFGGFYQAKLGENFHQRGINVELQSAGPGTTVWQLVDQGKSDFGTASADEVLIARSKQADVVAIFAVYQKSPQGIMTHSSRGFTTMKDIFTNSGTLAAERNAWLKFLENKFRDGPKFPVNIIANQPGIAEFLASPTYSQQCFVTAEPISAERKGSDPQTFLVADEGFNPYVTVLITSGKTLREEPEVVSKVVAACRDGWRAYLDNPTAADDLMSKLNPRMDQKAFPQAAGAQKPLIETNETRKNGLGTMTLERWQQLRQQLIDLGELTAAGAPPAEGCFVNVK